MKHLLTLVTLLVGINALAQERSFDLRPNDLSLNPISSEIKDVRGLCPKGAYCFMGGTAIDLRFHLGGCLDRLTPVDYRAISADDVLHVYVSAMRVFNKASMTARCAKENTKDVSLILPNQYIGSSGKIILHFLGAEDVTWEDSKNN